VAVISTPGVRRPLHPLLAILLAFPLPLFLGALLSDLAYSATFHIQWANFASWLIAGGLVGGGLVALWALVDLFRVAPRHRKWQGAWFVVLLAMFVVGFVNALVHAKDAWAAMPAGLWLSAVTLLLALGAAWMGYSRFREGDAT
jgi:uncharacterized membrane protein